jgi:hypothetical protein
MMIFLLGEIEDEEGQRRKKENTILVEQPKE